MQRPDAVRVILPEVSRARRKVGEQPNMADSAPDRTERPPNSLFGDLRDHRDRCGLRCGPVAVADSPPRGRPGAEHHGPRRTDHFRQQFRVICHPYCSLDIHIERRANGPSRNRRQVRDVPPHSGWLARRVRRRVEQLRRQCVGADLANHEGYRDLGAVGRDRRLRLVADDRTEDSQGSRGAKVPGPLRR